ncbi:c-type cytochrome [Methanococcoides seepicolus]|uniref:Cytochrome c n=1 Tax=Methanococcoides seepicolus TaxID=2828780 RepID=A0A9E4ZHR1_9EURY|nr:cytochrome c [Methanococcoides seepicolus]MCM1987841.1 cytochrome c [Methanococcoides seepicolus]
MKKPILLFFLGIAIVVSGCVNLMGDSYDRPSQEYFWHEPGYMYPDQYDRPLPSDIASQFDLNGELIYYTGYNEEGQLIPASGGPHWLYVHGGSCVSCHGVSGRGGVPIMMGTDIPSDIRYSTLTAEDENANETVSGHDEHPAYTDETIKEAIRDGIEPDGEELDYTMPRWDMSDDDIEDLIDYLKTL